MTRLHFADGPKAGELTAGLGTPWSLLFPVPAPFEKMLIEPPEIGAPAWLDWWNYEVDEYKLEGIVPLYKYAGRKPW